MCREGFESDRKSPNGACTIAANPVETLRYATHEFKCKRSVTCIDKRLLCDGDYDCPDQSDEDTSSSDSSSIRAQQKGKSLKQTEHPLPELGKLKLAPSSQFKPPKRPVPAASLRRQISLSANHFQVSVKKGTIYHYDVEDKETVTAVLKR